jgi:hypothetical protein
MDSHSDSNGLKQLRHRFLMEEPARLTEWLWEEHPQTAAFLLNWLGDSRMLSAYLRPLPPLQQADILHRIASLDPDEPLSPLQQEILVDTLRRVSSYLREAGAELIPDDPLPIRGERLYRAHLDSLTEEDRKALLVQMEEVNGLLARLGSNLMARPGEAGGGEERTFHFLMNAYGDLLSHNLSCRGFGTTLVFPDTVEMVSAAGFVQDAPVQLLPFRLMHAESRSGLYLLLSPSLFYHYLECAFGAQRPQFLHRPSKAEFSEIDSHVALTLAATLADALALVIGLEGAQGGYQSNPVDPAELSEELSAFGKTPLLSCQFTVKIGQTVAGKIGLLWPPSHLRELRALTGSDLFQNLIPETLPVPRRGSGGAAGRSRARKAMPMPGSVTFPAGGEGGGEGEESALSLEEFLWRIELEEAEKASGQVSGRPTQPIDLLLQGYEPQQIARQGGGSREEKERLADLHYQYGARFFQIGQYAAATEALERAMAANAHHEGAQLLMAAAWGEQGMYFKEILAYKKMVAEGAALTEAQVLLARRLSFLGRAEEAFQALEGAIQRGFQPKEIVEADPCFKSLRRSVKWRQYLADQS